MTIDARVEMFHSGIWNTITSDVRYRDGIRIDYGQPDWTSDADPTTLALTLDNTAAKYSPQDPASALFGKIGRGTKLRARIGPKNASLALPGAEGSYASTPDVAALDIVGDIDMRKECDPDTWRPDDFLAFARKYVTTGDQRSWAWWLTALGELRVRWSPDGTIASAITITSTAVIPEASGRLAIRWTLDVDNGATGNDVKFYTAASLAGPWTQLGATVTTAGVTSIFSSSAALEVGRMNSSDLPGITDDPFAGRIHAFELRNGIDGTVVANPDFTVRDAGDVSFTDAAGRAWTLHGAAVIADSSVRASAAAVSWRPAWDETATDARQSVTASGVLRRLGQGQEPLRSSLFRDFVNKGNLVAYWPLEDGRDATRFAPAIGTDHLSYSGNVSLAASDVFAASDNLPTVGDGRIYGPVRAYVGNADQRVLVPIDVPADGVAAETQLLYLHTRGTAKFWILSLKIDGSLRIQALDDGGTSLLDSALGFALEGKRGILSLWLSQVGAAIDWQVSFFPVGGSASVLGGTLAAQTWGSFGHIRIGGLGGADLAGVTVGHLAIMNGDVHTGLWATVGSSLTGWAGETAGARMLRLTAEEGIPLRMIGRPADTERLGPQGITEVLTLLGDAAVSDLGRFGERQDAEGLLYRTRASLYNQSPALTLNMNNGQVVNPFDPPLDDQTVRNDITVTREGGSSSRAVREDGPLSTQDPPDGIGGSYKDSPTLSLFTDGQTADQATWRLHLGTVDEHRIASLEIELEHNATLQQAVLELEVGDLIRVTNPPAGLPPGPLDLIALGWSDQITPHEWRVTINCAPGSPWTVGEVAPNAPAAIGASDPNRADTDGSELAAAFVAGTATSMSVSVTAGPLWTTAASEFPLHIRAGGVVLNVTAITGATSPQTFTITQTPVNGITKTIATGTDVRLAQPAIAAL